MAVKILVGDCREVLASMAEASVQACITSPPYW
jgi:DNA modification methylase